MQVKEEEINLAKEDKNTLENDTENQNGFILDFKIDKEKI